MKKKKKKREEVEIPELFGDVRKSTIVPFAQGNVVVVVRAKPSTIIDPFLSWRKKPH